LSRDAGVSLVRKFVADGQLDLGASLLTAIAGFGFYIKKLVIPWPLNFTIFEVPEYYLWVGLLGFFLLAYCTWRRDIIGGLFLAAACIGLSAILVLLLRPAWTPVAERYLYLPSTFFCLALVLTVCRLFSRFRHPLVAPLVLTLFFTTTAYATFERNLVWQDNVRLFEDTVSKSPDFPFARSVLADLRREAGREAESKAMIQANTAPEGLRNADFLDLKRVELLLQENSYEESSGQSGPPSGAEPLRSGATGNRRRACLGLPGTDSGDPRSILPLPARSVSFAGIRPDKCHPAF
jgi:hypothetical protein